MSQTNISYEKATGEQDPVVPDIQNQRHQFFSHIFLRTAWIFQALVAGPIAIGLGFSALFRLLEVHGPFYPFLMQFWNAIIASCIVFIVLIQRKIPDRYDLKATTVHFEEAKSALATALWLWLTLDAGLSVETRFNTQASRLGAAFMSSALLL